MSVNYAQIGFSSSFLSTDFGQALALKKTGLSFDELAKIVGLFKRGPKKGKLKGFIHWHKVMKPGWVRMGAYDRDEGRANGFVVKFALNFGFGISNYNGDYFNPGIVNLWGHPREIDMGRVLQMELSKRENVVNT